MRESSPSLPKACDPLLRQFPSRLLFHRMMSRQKIDLDTVRWKESEDIVYRALHTCSRCTVKGPCTAWLAGGEPPLNYVRFCPNAEAIETLRIVAG